FHKFNPSLLVTIDNLISKSDCNKLIELMKNSNQEAPVTIQGRRDFIDDRIGSKRATCWSETLAKSLHEKIKRFLYPRSMDDRTATDWWQGEKHRNWEPVGVSPLWRFMRYEKEGQHYAHYDA